MDPGAGIDLPSRLAICFTAYSPRERFEVKEEVLRLLMLMAFS